MGFLFCWGGSGGNVDPVEEEGCGGVGVAVAAEDVG